MFALHRHGKLALRRRIQVPRPILPGQRLPIDPFLQRHKRVQQSFRPRRAAGNMHVHRNIAIDPLQHVVSLLERAAGDGACPHRNHILGLRHLVIKPHHLRSHLLGHRSGNDHQVSLSRRRPKNLRPKPRQVIPRHGRSDHLDGATRQPKLHRPDGAPPAPVIQLFDGRYEDPLLAQFDLQSTLNSH